MENAKLDSYTEILDIVNELEGDISTQRGKRHLRNLKEAINELGSEMGKITETIRKSKKGFFK